MLQEIVGFFAVITSLFVWRRAYMDMLRDPAKYPTPFAASLLVVGMLWSVAFVAVAILRALKSF